MAYVVDTSLVEIIGCSSDDASSKETNHNASGLHNWTYHNIQRNVTITVLVEDYILPNLSHNIIVMNTENPNPRIISLVQFCHLI